MTAEFEEWNSFAVFAASAFQIFGRFQAAVKVDFLALRIAD